MQNYLFCVLKCVSYAQQLCCYEQIVNYISSEKEVRAPQQCLPPTQRSSVSESCVAVTLYIHDITIVWDCCIGVHGCTITYVCKQLCHMTSYLVTPRMDMAVATLPTTRTIDLHPPPTAAPVSLTPLLL